MSNLCIEYAGYLARAPVKALQAIRPESVQDSDRIFPMTPRSIRNRISAACKAAGLEGRFSGHSPRIGVTVDLVRKGASVAAVQQVGGWKSSNMPAYYARRETASRNAVATYLETS